MPNKPNAGPADDFTVVRNADGTDFSVVRSYRTRQPVAVGGRLPRALDGQGSVVAAISAT